MWDADGSAVWEEGVGVLSVGMCGRCVVWMCGVFASCWQRQQQQQLQLQNSCRTACGFKQGAVLRCGTGLWALQVRMQKQKARSFVFQSRELPPENAFKITEKQFSLSGAGRRQIPLRKHQIEKIPAHSTTDMTHPTWPAGSPLPSSTVSYTSRVIAGAHVPPPRSLPSYTHANFPPAPRPSTFDLRLPSVPAS